MIENKAKAAIVISAYTRETILPNVSDVVCLQQRNWLHHVINQMHTLDLFLLLLVVWTETWLVVTGVKRI